MGIPFAAPPVGKNRWRSPQPVQNWECELKAFEFAPISMQAPTVIDVNNIYTREWSVDPDLPMDEDCLYLNVWTLAVSADEKLPVFVWYFGGGLQVGHIAEMEFDGERFARRGIVVVTVNYRLNAFGFLCHPEITAESPDAPANFGLGNGDPNGKDSTGEELPLWKPCTPEAPYGMVFADKAEFVEEPPGEVMQFLVEQYLKRQSIHG